MSNLFTGTTPEIDPNQDYLNELVGEGKKYRDPQALAFSKVHADKLIEDLKSELQKTQQELQTRNSLEELLTSATKVRENVEPPPANHDQNRNDEVNGLTAETVEQLIQSRLSQHEKTRTASDNIRAVKQALTEQYGPDYENVVAKAAQAAGVSLEWMQEQAQVNPKLVLSITQLNAPKKETFVTPPATKLNVDIAPQDGVRNWSYYQKIKAKDPKYYESKQVQSQMEKDALRLRESFFA